MTLGVCVNLPIKPFSRQLRQCCIGSFFRTTVMQRQYSSDSFEAEDEGGAGEDDWESSTEDQDLARPGRAMPSHYVHDHYAHHPRRQANPPPPQHSRKPRHRRNVKPHTAQSLPQQPKSLTVDRLLGIGEGIFFSSFLREKFASC